MSENAYRLSKVILLAVLVFGFLLIGGSIAQASRRLAQATAEASQNGRYIQYDLGKEYSPDGRVHQGSPPMIDTRTGKQVNLR